MVRIFQNISIRKKLLVSMLIFTLLPILFVCTVTTTMAYRAMRNQLIYDYRMSSRWLQNRLELENDSIMTHFYKFDIDKNIRSDIFRWCLYNEDLCYSARWRVITVMNTIMSMNSSIHSVELFNLEKNEVLIAERSGAHIDKTDIKNEVLTYWSTRNSSLQSNLVFLRTDKELLAYHLIHHFDDKRPVAMIVFHFLPYHIQEILYEIRTVPEETILILNDQNDLIAQSYGTDWKLKEKTVENIRQELSGNKHQETFRDGQFWFYRSVNSGKIQLILSLPNRTIINALLPTITVSIAAAVLAILSSIFCSITYSKSVSKPIQALSNEMKTLTLNEYHIMPQENRQDEIGILQDSFHYMIARNKELITQQYQAKLEKRNAQLRALQAQINPHFMYNTLQVIGGMALEKEAPEIYSITIALSDILRYSLNFSQKMVSLEEETEYLKSYIMIQNERFGGRIQLNFRLAPTTVQCLIPKLILQPIAENSFEHGLPNKPGTWILTIESEITENNDLLVRIKDNGTGIEPDRLSQIKKMIDGDASKVLITDSHIGLLNVHMRVKLLSSNENHGISIISTPETGTTVNICMPVSWRNGG